MPRISSTSCITGTGFMKWNPMNFSGRSVPEASRVIEIDEVFEVRMVCGARCGTSALKIWCFSASFSVAASMTRSLAPIAASSGSMRMRASAASRSASVIRPRATWRSRLPRMIAGAASSAAADTSCSATSKPDTAKTWAMPLPICPAPITPMRLISMQLRPVA